MCRGALHYTIFHRLSGVWLDTGEECCRQLVQTNFRLWHVLLFGAVLATESDSIYGQQDHLRLLGSAWHDPFAFVRAMLRCKVLESKLKCEREE